MKGKKLMLLGLCGLAIVGTTVMAKTSAVTYYPYTSNSYSGYHNPMDQNSHQAQVPVTTGWEPTPQYDHYYNKDIGGQGTVNGRANDDVTATTDVNKAQSTNYYTTQKGNEQTGYNTVNGYQDHLANDKLSSGWSSDSGGKFFRDSDNSRLTGWKNVDGSWYYFCTDGYMRTGWQKVGNNWFTLGSDGKMITGWKSINSKWYYFSSNGAMKTGWAFIGGKWYYLNSDGTMGTGWASIDGKWYFLENSGAMKTGWFQQGSNWYFLNGSGNMRTSDFKLNGTIYRVNSSGICKW